MPFAGVCPNCGTGGMRMEELEEQGGPYDRLVGSESIGNVASSRRLNLGELKPGDWVATESGEVLEYVGPDPPGMVFRSVRSHPDHPGTTWSPVRCAREFASVVHKAG